MRYDSQQALVTDIRRAHDALCAQLREIPKSRCAEPGVWGDGWSVSDLVAHLAEWQSMFLVRHDEGLTGAMPRMPATGFRWNETPKANRVIWEKLCLRSLPSVRADFDSGYRRILAIVDSLSGEQLLMPGHFAWTGQALPDHLPRPEHGEPLSVRASSDQALARGY